MSYSKTQAKKRRKSERTPEERQVANKIRNGTFPRYFFLKQEAGSNQLQRGPEGLTWKMESTYMALTAKAPAIREDVNPETRLGIGLEHEDNG